MIVGRLERGQQRGRVYLVGLLRILDARSDASLGGFDVDERRFREE